MISEKSKDLEDLISEFMEEKISLEEFYERLEEIRRSD